MKKSVGTKQIAIYPTPVLAVGTYAKDGAPNVMTVAWGGICCSLPPCVAVSVRSATLTYENLRERKAFTVSLPSERHVREADYFGIASGQRENKFETSGLTPAKSGLVDAPYVEEFPYVLECRVIREIELGLHTQFIGEVLDIKADEECIADDGVPDVEKLKPILFIPDSFRYRAFGRDIGRAFSIGNEIKKK